VTEATETREVSVSDETAPVERPRRLRREPNPLLVKELRGRMRGARAFIILTVYLLLLGCIISIVYQQMESMYTLYSGRSWNASDMADLGEAIFATVVVFQILMVTAVTPSLTATSISGERERGTYELLRTTTLRARGVVSGKFYAAVVFTGLLVLAALPLESLAFVLGGVVLVELVVAQVILLITAVFSAAVGVFFSALMRTTRASNGLTYFTMFLTTILFPILFLVLGSLYSFYTYAIGGSSFGELLMTYFVPALNPITAAILSKQFLLDDQTIWFLETLVSGKRVWVPSPWITLTVVYGILSLLLLWLATLRVRRQETR